MFALVENVPVPACIWITFISGDLSYSHTKFGLLIRQIGRRIIFAADFPAEFWGARVSPVQAILFAIS